MTLRTQLRPGVRIQWSDGVRNEAGGNMYNVLDDDADDWDDFVSLSLIDCVNKLVDSALWVIMRMCEHLMMLLSFIIKSCIASVYVLLQVFVQDRLLRQTLFMVHHVACELNGLLQLQLHVEPNSLLSHANLTLWDKCLVFPNSYKNTDICARCLDKSNLSQPCLSAKADVNRMFVAWRLQKLIMLDSRPLVKRAPVQRISLNVVTTLVTKVWLLGCAPYIIVIQSCLTRPRLESQGTLILIYAQNSVVIIMSLESHTDRNSQAVMLFTITHL